MGFDPQTGQWVDDSQLAAPPVDPNGQVTAPDGTPLPVATDAAPPAQGPPPGPPPPIDDSISGAPQSQPPPAFEAPDHWFAPPQNQNEVDAISGGATRAHQYDQELAHPASNGLPVEAMQTPAEHAASVAANPDVPLSAREALIDDGRLSVGDKANALAKMTPEELAAYNEQQNAIRLHDEGAAKLRVAQDNLNLQRQSMSDMAAAQKHAADATALVQADAQKLAARTISTRPGIVAGIAGILMSAIGGAAAGYSGGRNLALDQINKNIDNDIAAQKDDIANAWSGINTRKGAISDELARHGDLYRAQETFRVASYDKALSDIETRKQDFAPDGTRAGQLAQLQQGIAGQRAATIQKLGQTAYDNRLKSIKEERDNFIAQQSALQKAASDAEVARHNKAGEGAEWAKIGIEKDKAAAAKADDQVLSPEQFGGLYGKDAALPPVPMSQKQYGVWLKTKGDNVELGTKQGAAVDAANKGTVAAPIQIGVDDDGKTKVKTSTLVNDDGMPWKAPEKFTEMLTGAANVNRLANKLSREMDAWGGQSDTVKSAKWQTIKGDYQDLVFALHGAKGIEGFRPGTAEQLHELTGDVDPTSFMRSAKAGVLNARDNVNDDVNQTATTARYTGHPITFQDDSAPPAPKKTEVDQLQEKLNTNYASGPLPPGQSTDAEFWQRSTDPSGGHAMQYQQQYGFTPEVDHALQVGIPPSRLEAINKLVTAMNGKDSKAATAARKALEDAESSNPDGNIRNYVSALLAPSPSGSPGADR